MAENIREIKKRIESVKKTEKITQAMKMVSAAKFKRNVKRLDQIKAYGRGIESIIDSLSVRLFNDDLSPLLFENNASKDAYIVLSSDRGLCGGFNSNLFRKIQSHLANVTNADLYCIGNKSTQFFKARGITITESISSLSDDEVLTEVMDKLTEQFLDGRYANVYVFYNEFVSALSSNLIKKRLLPIDLPKWDKSTTTTADFIYEPSKESTLTKLFSKYASYQFLRALKDSSASEEGFRMAAMDSATSNAKDMIQELTLFYNRSRQAAITTELTEIVAGAASIS